MRPVLDRPSFSLFALVSLALFLASTWSLAGEVRTWTDKSGKFKIDAEFIELKEGKVRLKDSDGDVISVPLGKLSKEDQQFLREQAKRRKNSQRSQGTQDSNSLQEEFRESLRRGGSFEFQGSRTTDDGTHQSFSFRYGSGRGSGRSDDDSSRNSLYGGGIWTDITGKHRIEASFVGLQDGNVSLRRADGKIIKLPLAKLSQTDQERAKKLASSSSGVSDSTSPFGDSALDEAQTAANLSREVGEFYRGDIVEVSNRGGSEIKRGVVLKCENERLTVLYDGEERTDTVHLGMSFEQVRLLKANPEGANYSEGGFKLSKLNLSSYRTISVELPATATFEPDGIATDSSTTYRGFPISAGKGDVFDKYMGLAFLPSAQKIFVAKGSDRHGFDRDKQSSSLLFFDMNSGRLVEQHRLDSGISHAAVSPSGRRIATCEAGKSVSDNRTLHLWGLESSQLNRTDSWDPHAKEFFKQVSGLQWIDEQRLITTGFKDLMVWDVDSRTLLFKIESAGGRESYTLSPNRKQLLVAGRKGIIVIDLASGDVVKNVEPKEERNFGRIAICPSGQLLAASHRHGKKIDLINLETGETFDTLNLDAKGREKVGFFWPDNQHILIGGTDLVHVASKVEVWKYQHNASEVVFADGYCWYLMRGKFPGESYVVPLEIPQPEVEKIDESELALQPGDVVSLEIEMTFNLNSRHNSIFEETRKKLTKDLEDAGFFVSEGAPNTLVASTEDGEQKEIHYRRFGEPMRSGGVAMKVTPRIYKLKLVSNGETVWERRQAQSPSYHLRLNEGETISDAVQREMEPSPDYFGIGIPSRILKPDLASSRVSKVTMKGLE